MNPSIRDSVLGYKTCKQKLFAHLDSAVFPPLRPVVGRPGRGDETLHADVGRRRGIRGTREEVEEAREEEENRAVPDDAHPAVRCC